MQELNFLNSLYDTLDVSLKVITRFENGKIDKVRFDMEFQKIMRKILIDYNEKDIETFSDDVKKISYNIFGTARYFLSSGSTDRIEDISPTIKVYLQNLSILIQQKSS
jgi:hypothetical protein